MSNIIIIGAGGLASDMISYLENAGHQIKGILSDSKSDYDNLKTQIQYLGEIEKYTLSSDDLFIVAIGKNPNRASVFLNFQKKGARFFTFIHSTAIICQNVNIGYGAIIGPYSVIGSNSEIGAGCFLNKFCSVGHHSIIEKNTIISPFGFVGGNCYIKENSSLSLRSSILPGISVGRNCVISAHCVVRKNIDDETLFFSEKIMTKIRSN